MLDMDSQNIWYRILVSEFLVEDN